MHFEGIDFPWEVVDAASEGSLVVFAGAGVSMQDGLRFPNFGGLVEKIRGSLVSPSEQGATAPRRRAPRPTSATWRG